MTARLAAGAALFALLSDLPGVVSSARRFVHWRDVDWMAMPALFLVRGDEDGQGTSGQPTQHRLSFDLVLYAHTPDPAAVAFDQLEPILDAIDQALAAGPGRGTQTLGGLVKHCRVSGRTVTDRGALSEYAVAIVPIELLLV